MSAAYSSGLDGLTASPGEDARVAGEIDQALGPDADRDRRGGRNREPGAERRRRPEADVARRGILQPHGDDDTEIEERSDGGREDADHDEAGLARRGGRRKD